MLHPKYVRMFHSDDIENFNPATELVSGNETTTTALPVVGVSLDTNTTNEEGATNFEFLVPASVLKTASSPSNVIAIYNTNNRTERGKPSAYVLLEEGQEIVADGESNIKIIWTMTISNK